MRLTTIFLLAFCLTASAGGYSQNVTLSVRNVKLEKVFKEIKKQTGYVFFYDGRVIEDANRVSLNVRNKPVEDVVRETLRGQPLDFSIAKKTITIFEKADNSLNALRTNMISPPQGIIPEITYATITGTVKDAQGNPLAGVSVIVKGTKRGTSTAADGSFSVEANVGDALVFTMVGYRSIEVPVKNMQPLTAILEVENTSESEIVVVGYGTQKKENLTGAVSQVTSEVLEGRSLPNLTQGLQGEIPNLNIVPVDGKPTTSPEYNVRGTTSIGQGGSALVLIDGVEGDPSMINPNDVASVTVLKDASSAAIYGARGAFGVVLITTKSAKEGKTSITYSSDYSLKKPTSIPDQVTNGYEYVKSFSEAYSSRYNYTLIAQNINKTQEFSQEYLDAFKEHNENPSLPKTEVNSNGDYVYYANTDWYNLLYKDHNFATSQNIAVTGSSEKSSFYITGRLLDQTGIFRYNSDDYKMYNLRLKGTIWVLPWLEVTNNTYYTNTKYHSPYNVGEAGGIWANMSDEAHPSAPLLNPDGTLTYSAAYTVGDLYYGKNGIDFNNRTISSTTGFVARFFNNKFRINGNFTFQNVDGNQIRKRVPVPYSTKVGVINYLGTGFNDLQKTFDKTTYISTNLYGEYEKAFSAKHHLKAMVGYNFEQSKQDKSFVLRNGLIFPDANNLNLALGQSISTGSDWDQWDILGGFYRINYDFKQKYLVEVNGRYDGSSKFPKNQQFGFFPSFSVGWRLSNESFWKLSKKGISDLKIRGSYGTLGNGNIKSYSFLENFVITQSDKIINGEKPQITSQPNVIPDGLTWEKSTTGDIGIDALFLNYRLSLSGDYYVRRTTDMFTVGPTLPDVFGTTVPKGNNADLKTTGYELVIGWSDQFNLGTKPFKYNIQFNISGYKSIIQKFNNPNKKLSDFYEGQKVGEIWGYVTDGFWTAQDVDKAADFMVNLSTRIPVWLPGDIKMKDLDGDGVITHGNETVSNPGDMKIIGNTIPRYSYGLNLNFNWNNFFLGGFIQGLGRTDWYPSAESDNFWGQYNRPYNVTLKSQVNKIWSESNPNTYFPRLRGYVASKEDAELFVKQTRYLQNAGYIRLKNIQLGYNFRQELISKLKMTAAKLYISADNIYTWSPMFKYTGHNIDPESIHGSENITGWGDGDQGDGQNYPILKSINIGMSITF